MRQTKLRIEETKSADLHLVTEEHSPFAYRPDIDGLRAIAVLSVVIFHIFPTLIPGGFIGVDIFFVISGYLISSIIFKNMETGSFSFFDFYSRRIKRIFPSLLMILIFVSIVGWISLLPGEYKNLEKMVSTTTIFMTNIALKNDVGYFADAAELKPLLHIWSLSIEEQFYIFYPLFIYLMYKFGRRLLPATLVLGCIISFAINAFYISSKPTQVFYLLPFRSWELSIGAILAYIKLNNDSTISQLYKKHSNILALCGLACIIVAMTMFDKSTTFPGWAALLPTAGAVLLIAGKDSRFNQMVLAHPVCVWVGLISYSLYLWHWPLISFAHIAGQTDITTKVSILCASIVLAGLSTFLIEKPIRRAGNKSLYFLIAGMICCFGFAKLVKHDFIETKDRELVEKIDKATGDWQYPSKNLSQANDPSIPFHSFGKGKHTIVFFGDSNVEQYWPRIEKLMLDDPNLQEKYKVVFSAYGGQAPIPGYYANDKLVEFLDTAVKYVYDSSVDTVVIAANWIGHLEVENERSKSLFHDFESMIQDLRAQNKTIYLILNIPVDIRQNPKSLVKRNFLAPFGISNDKSYDHSEWMRRSRYITKELTTIAKRNGCILIDPKPYLCPDGKCMIVDKNNVPMYKDEHHFTGNYAKDNLTFIDKILGK